MKNLIILTILIIIVGCGNAAKSNKTNHSIKTWKNGEVTYFFDSNISDSHKNKIIKAFNDIEDKTKCIYFVEVESTNTSAVKISYSSENISYGTVGYNETNTIQLSKKMNTRSIYHETLHVLGLFHEHQRPDRDNYINIVYDNIIESAKSYFDVREPIYNIDLIPYDNSSIMHYSPSAFSKNDESTIQFYNESEYNYSSRPTELDYQKLISIYGN